MKIVQSLEKFDSPSIFLAGPMRREFMTLWRDKAIELLESFNGYIVSPEYGRFGKPEDWTYSRQVSWEVESMVKADVILFWIPRSEDLPGFTTNIEVGEWLHSDKIVIGAPDDADKIRYIKERCSHIGIPWYNSLGSIVRAAMEKVTGSRGKIWITADTHFTEERTLSLSKRPYSSVDEMDSDMIDKWNSVVSTQDTVYHLGDFGNLGLLFKLNFAEMYFLPGNYDKDINSLVKNKQVKTINTGETIILQDKKFILVHEPENGRIMNGFFLFGHIHKLQMVKRNGLNVGVDCHNFYPIDIDTVLFYRNAIEKHYDENVFMENI